MDADTKELAFRLARVEVVEIVDAAGVIWRAANESLSCICNGEPILVFHGPPSEIARRLLAELPRVGAERTWTLRVATGFVGQNDDEWS